MSNQSQNQNKHVSIDMSGYAMEAAPSQEYSSSYGSSNMSSNVMSNEISDKVVEKRRIEERKNYYNNPDNNSYVNVSSAYAHHMGEINNVGCNCETAQRVLDTNYLIMYICSLLIFALIWQFFHDIGLSTLLTFAVLIQVMALSCLLMAVHVRKSVAGLSMRSLAMQGISFALRLCSTSWLKGYIPVDSTGDWLYQFADFCALCLCLQILWLAQRTYKSTYQKAVDDFPAEYCVIGACVLAALIHPDLNNRPIFDSIWTASLYIDVVSTLPQIWMIGRIGGQVDALSAHYVALVACSRFVDVTFWYYGFEELAPENGGFNVAGWVVLGSHLLHLLLMWDFIFCYFRSAIMRGEGFSGKDTLDFTQDLAALESV